MGELVPELARVIFIVLMSNFYSPLNGRSTYIRIIYVNTKTI